MADDNATQKAIDANKLAESEANRKAAEARERDAENQDDQDEGPGFLSSIFSFLKTAAMIIIGVLLAVALLGGGKNIFPQIGAAIKSAFSGDMQGAGEHASQALGAAGDSIKHTVAQVGDFGKSVVAHLTGSSKENTNTAMAYFQQAGWSSAASAGIVGNLLCESGLQVNASGDHNIPGGSCGIAQWNRERKISFQQFTGHTLEQSTDLKEQLAFVNWELTKGPYKDAGAELARATTPQQAADIICRHYEVPANVNYESAKRQNVAEQVATNFVPANTPVNPNLATASYIAK